MALRYKNWERAAITEVFSRRKPLLTHKDDMTIDSDRDLLRGMLKNFQNNPGRFKLFDLENVVGATSEEHTLQVESVFREHCDSLLKNQSVGTLDEEAVEEVVEECVIKMKRGPGRPPKTKNRPSWYIIAEPIQPATGTPNSSADLVQKSATPETGGRPKRQAARLSFATGVPVQNTTAIDDDDEDKELPPPRSLTAQVRKIVTVPVSLPASSETKRDVAGPDSASRLRGGSGTSNVGSSSNPELQSGPQAGTETADQSNTTNGPLPNGIDKIPDQWGYQPSAAPIIQANHEIDSSAAPLAQGELAYAPPLDLQAKYAALQVEHDILEGKYRRWRSSVVDNAKLLVDQEADVEAKKDIITESTKTIKQLSSDNARLGAELALARGMVHFNPALLKQSFLRGSLSLDVVERLFSNPDFIQLMQPRPANGEVPPPASTRTQDPSLVRPKKRRRTTAAVLSDPEAEEARQKKLSRVIAPKIKRLESSRFKLSAVTISSLFDADTAESKRFLDSLIDFAKLPTITFDEAFTLIKEAQQDRRQGHVIVPQLRLSDPAWAPWDVKTAQKRYMQRNGMVKNDAEEIVAVSKNPENMEEMVAATRRSTIEVVDEKMVSTDNDEPASAPAADETRKNASSRHNGRSESGRVWERHVKMRRERELREQEEQRAAMLPLDMTDPLQALAASIFTPVNGPSRTTGRLVGMNSTDRLTATDLGYGNVGNRSALPF
jgi:hypothetical protein